MATITLDQIDTVRIASPCSMSWDDMEGDNVQRYCGECKLNVYNFAGMTRQQIADLLAIYEGNVCGQIYRRADGTIITRDCPVGLARLRRSTATMLLRVAAAIGILVTAAMLLTRSDADQKESARLRAVQPFARLAEAIDPQPAPVIRGRVALGSICPPAAPAQTKLSDR